MAVVQTHLPLYVTHTQAHTPLRIVEIQLTHGASQTTQHYTYEVLRASQHRESSAMSAAKEGPSLIQSVGPQ